MRIKKEGQEKNKTKMGNITFVSKIVFLSDETKKKRH